MAQPMISKNISSRTIRISKTEASLLESFEECAILLHYTPQDEIDTGMFCLFANKSDPKELFAALHNLFREKVSRLQELSHLQELYAKCAVPRFINECWKDALIKIK
ncbi:hypothetical protein Glove_275g87 [Diversispora epigaea]|uniref:Uncharacterized protein n=1 Tax=Diversispora epigaea TaxID=1348612 RepID=A0A397I9L1_9GLOM|nr:hypothetical protein Glove_275g87 [Diversispora epigaea]